MAFELSRTFQDLYLAGVLDPGAQTGNNIATAFVFETSGDAVFIYFVSPVTQSSGTLDLTFYIDALTGLPDFNFEMRNGPGAADDADRPEVAGSTIGTPGANISPGVVNRWYKLSMTALSLTAGNAYFAILKNVSGTPASNHADIVFRGQLDGSPTRSDANSLIRSGFTINGFTTDPTIGAGMTPMILTFNDASPLGLPYVESGAPASGTDWRGNRVQFDTDIVCSGFQFSGASASLQTGLFRIFQGATQIATVTGNRTTSQARISQARFMPVTLTAGVDYDFVFQPSSASSIGTFYDMGQGTIPSEVAAAGYHQSTYVTGATPGSFAETTAQIMVVSPIIDKYIAGVGGDLIIPNKKIFI